MRKLFNIYYYIQGYIRYYLYYSKFNSLLFLYIKNQIKYRINSMDSRCYNDGSCKICGCKTTPLQMCNKACDKPCYPSMLSRRVWNRVTNKKLIPYNVYIITDEFGRFKLLSKTFILGKGLVWILDGNRFKVLNNG